MQKIKDWYLPNGDRHFEKYILRDKTYQKQEREYALSFVRNFRVALDIGAHVGFWSRDLVSIFGMVIAFEPARDAFDCLKKNVSQYYYEEKNCSHFFHPINIALGNRTGENGLQRNPGNSGQVLLDQYSSERVSVLALDNFAYNWQEIDFIKIDVEGFETFVLQGAILTITRCKPVICLEDRQDNKARFLYRTDYRDPIQILESLGMKQVGQIKHEKIFSF